MAKKPINPAKYRHQIVIRQAPTDASRNVYGERTGAGAVLATVWAEKQDWGGKDAPEMGRDTADVTTRFVMRYRTDVAAEMTVEHAGISYHVEAVMDMDGLGKETTLVCRRVS